MSKDASVLFKGAENDYIQDDGLIASSNTGASNGPEKSNFIPMNSTWLIRAVYSRVSHLIRYSFACTAVPQTVQFDGSRASNKLSISAGWPPQLQWYKTVYSHQQLWLNKKLFAFCVAPISHLSNHFSQFLHLTFFTICVDQVTNVVRKTGNEHGSQFTAVVQHCNCNADL